MKQGEAFAPTNIALCKYWGKRNTLLNLPVTNSLSIALPGKGAHTKISCNSEAIDKIVLNQTTVAADSAFAKRLVTFLDLFREGHCFDIEIEVNIPIAAGLASSACGFASVVLALDDLFGWQLPKQTLSILARLGSGSAARSLWYGFVEWHAGTREDGMDSYAEPLNITWPGLCVGLLPISDQPKAISSREAMQRTVETSPLFATWPTKAIEALQAIKQALFTHDFNLLGATSEANAEHMHATMLASVPAINYSLPETLHAKKQVQQLRNMGTPVYFTQDAGPNLKLLFLKENEKILQEAFPTLAVVEVFE